MGDRTTQKENPAFSDQQARAATPPPPVALPIRNPPNPTNSSNPNHGRKTPHPPRCRQKRPTDPLYFPRSRRRRQHQLRAQHCPYRRRHAHPRDQTTALYHLTTLISPSKLL